MNWIPTLYFLATLLLAGLYYWLFDPIIGEVVALTGMGSNTYVMGLLALWDIAVFVAVFGTLWWMIREYQRYKRGVIQ